MRRSFLLATAVLATVSLLSVAGAAAQDDHAHDHGTPAPAPGPPRADPDAPEGAPPHWIPSSQWVLNHWVPYDEARLLALLRIDRRALWRHLRDDRVPLGTVAVRRGWNVRALARRLVAPRRVSRAMRATLVRRAEDTLTQGHMAQHILFHTLHQEVLPQRAAHIFGVSSPRFRALRQRDIAPLEIARLAGRSRAAVERAAASVLREASRGGVRSGAVSRRQARLVLDRQLRQLPRWLAHRRYNGPPHTEAGRLVEPLRPHALMPSLDHAGELVAYEQTQHLVPRARAEGEIGVRLHRTADASLALGPRPAVPGAPCSAYASSLSGDGRFAVVETSAGNMTFAKRYGNLRVLRVELATGRVADVLPSTRAGWTAYHPTISGDGSRVAFQLVRSRAGAPHAQVAWRDLRTGRLRVLLGRAEEPALSGDGRWLAFVRGRGIVLRDLSSGRERRFRVRGGAAEPALSLAGDLVFTAHGARGPRVLVLRRGDRVPRVLRHGAHDPAISADGRVVALSATHGLRHVSSNGRPRQDVLVVPLGGGPARRVGPSGGWAAHAALSRDGSVVALTHAGADRTEHVYVVRAGAGPARVDGEPGTEGALPIACDDAPPVW